MHGAGASIRTSGEAEQGYSLTAHLSPNLTNHYKQSECSLYILLNLLLTLGAGNSCLDLKVWQETVIQMSSELVESHLLKAFTF